MKTYIAIDIGASSDRLMKSELIDGQLTLTEVHRFKTGLGMLDGFQRWDINYLIQEIVVGLEKIKQNGIEHCYVGIDTWAVDYCLIDKDGTLLGDPIAYRDSRTKSSREVSKTNEFRNVVHEKNRDTKKNPLIQFFQLLVEQRELLEKVDKIAIDSRLPLGMSLPIKP